MAKAKKRTAMVGVGMPGWVLLNQFGVVLRDAFPGEVPYLVGTAAQGKQWRDVDVRIMLGQKAYARFVAYRQELHAERRAAVFGAGRANAFALAFSTLGRQMTGLPVDFQVQERDHANATYPGPRIALGLRW